MKVLLYTVYEQNFYVNEFINVVSKINVVKMQLKLIWYLTHVASNCCRYLKALHQNASYLSRLPKTLHNGCPGPETGHLLCQTDSQNCSCCHRGHAFADKRKGYKSIGVFSPDKFIFPYRYILRRLSPLSTKYLSSIFSRLLISMSSSRPASTSLTPRWWWPPGPGSPPPPRLRRRKLKGLRT